MEGARREIQRQPPWLLTSHGENNENHSFYNLVESRFHAKSIPELRNKHICISTYDGWLVLVDHFGTCSIWNPESNAKIELPHLHDSFDFNKCILSKPPTDPECQVLFISEIGFTRAFCKIGDNDYVYEKVDSVKGLDLLAITVSSGQVYGLIRHGYKRRARFVTVHFAEKALEFRPIMTIEENGEEKPWEIYNMWLPYITRLYHHLIESPYENQLLLVCQLCSYTCLDNIFEFRVFRVDLDKRECEELESINDHLSIFLTYQQGGVCVRCSSSSAGMKKNCIYYTDSYGRDMYVYDYNDRGKTLLLPCPDAKFYQSRNFWIEHQVISSLLLTFDLGKLHL